MSRIARKPIVVGQDIELKMLGSVLSIKGKHGFFEHVVHEKVTVSIDGNALTVFAKDEPHPMVGTTFKLLSNMVRGVSQLFERKLQLVGVGYRAKVQAEELELSLGYSKPVFFKVPSGVKVLVPTSTEIILQGIDNWVLGVVQAKICQFRPTELYKGKGIRPFGAKFLLKQTKKKK